MFQPQIETSIDLGFFAIVNLITSRPLPTCFKQVLDLFPSPPKLTPTTPQYVTIQRHSTYLCCTHFYPPASLNAEHSSTWTSPPPDGFHRSSLCLPPLPSLTCFPGPPSPLESRAACIWFPCPLSVLPPPPLATLYMRPGPCHTIGVLPSEGTSLPFLRCPHVFSPTSGFNWHDHGHVP